MKKQLFAIAAIVATLFASCAKEDNGSAEIPAGEKATLSIGVTAAPGSRAVGNLTDETDNEVKSFTAYVFRGEVLEAIMTSTDGAKVTETAKVTTAANAVYVLANATVAGVVEKSTSKTAFLAILSDLLSGTSLNVLNGTGQVWASGWKSIVIPTGTKTLDASVALTPGPARINLEVVDSRTNKSDNGAFVITEVQLLNVVGQMPYFTGQTYTKSWYTGYTGGDNTAAAVNAYFKNAYNTTDGKHYFYAYENDAAAFPTIITLVASNGTDTRYYPVHFTTTDAGYVVERGNSYQVKLTLTGKATEDPGIDDPEDEVSLATLGVEVTLNPWTMKTINKTF